MEQVVYTAFEFEKFSRSSKMHGFLSKRSNGIKSVIPRKRYFVLFGEALYWFKQEKTRYTLKGVLDLTDAVWLGYNDGNIHLGGNAKTYILSGGKKMDHWATTLHKSLQAKGHKRRSLSIPDNESRHSSTWKAYQTCPDIYKAELTSEALHGLSDEEDKAGKKAPDDGRLSLRSAASSSRSGRSSGVQESSCGHDSCLDSSEAITDTLSTAVSHFDLEDAEPASSSDEIGVGCPILIECVKTHAEMIDCFIQDEIDRDFLAALDIQHARGRVSTICIGSDTQESVDAEKPARAPQESSVRSAVAFFEKLNEHQAAGPRGRRASRVERRHRFSSLRKRYEGPPAPEFGGDSLEDFDFSGELPEGMLEKGYYKLHFNYDDSVDYGDSSASLASDISTDDDNNEDMFKSLSTTLSEEIAEVNDRGDRTFSALARSMQSMVAELNSITSDLQRQKLAQSETLAQMNLFADAREKKASIDSEDLLEMEVYEDSDSEEMYVNEDSYLDKDDASSPDFEDHPTIRAYVRSHIAFKRTLTALDLSKQFSHTHLPMDTLKKIYVQERKRQSMDNRVARRQNAEEGPFELIFDHFSVSGVLGRREFDAMLGARELLLKLTAQEREFIRGQARLPLDLEAFTALFHAIGEDLALKLRNAVEENVRKFSPLRRVKLMGEEMEQIEFGSDGQVQNSRITCVESGWTLLKQEEVNVEDQGSSKTTLLTFSVPS